MDRPRGPARPLLWGMLSQQRQRSRGRGVTGVRPAPPGGRRDRLSARLLSGLLSRCLRSRHYSGPVLSRGELPRLTDAWVQRIVSRSATDPGKKDNPVDPSRWRRAAEFLGGASSTEELRRLMVAFLVAEPTAGLPAVLVRLLRGRPRGVNDVVLNALEQAALRPAG